MTTLHAKGRDVEAALADARRVLSHHGYRQLKPAVAGDLRRILARTTRVTVGTVKASVKREAGQLIIEVTP